MALLRSETDDMWDLSQVMYLRIMNKNVEQSWAAYRNITYLPLCIILFCSNERDVHMDDLNYDINIDRRPLPNVRAYYMRLTSRQAFREHVMVSYDELRA